MAAAAAATKRRDRVDWILFLIAVFTISLNTYQSKRLDHNVKVSNWISIQNQTLDLDRTFLSHPEIQPYFFSGQDIVPGDKNYPVVFAQAEYVADFIDSTANFSDDVDLKMFDTAAWENYYRHLFRRSPILCRVVSADDDVYSQSLKRLSRQYCGQTGPRKSVYPMLPTP